MEVILLEKIENLGDLGAVVNVRSGYGRNFLIPAGKAKMATQENVAEFEARRAELEKQAQEAMDEANSRKEAIEGVSLEIPAKTGGEGKLFGSVSNLDIVQAFAEKDIAVEKREVRMPDGPIRQIGEYEIGIHLHSDVDATIKVNIIEAEESA